MHSVKPIDAKSIGVTRRSLLASSSFAAAAVGIGRLRSAAAAPAAGVDVTIEVFSATGQDQGPQTVAKIERTEADWRSRLTPEEFDVARRAGTETPFTGATWNEHAAGLYRCICCDTALYDSATKFDSGTGWPSFWQPIAAKNIVEREDRSFGMIRTEVSCVRCEAHLGHVFDDGPKPTGLRYCMNSAAMRFAPKATA